VGVLATRTGCPQLLACWVPHRNVLRRLPLVASSPRALLAPDITGLHLSSLTKHARWIQ